MKSILIISDVAPSNVFTGSQILSKISNELLFHTYIDWLILHDDNLGNYQVTEYMNFNKCILIRKPNENWSKIRATPFLIHIGEFLANLDYKNIENFLLEHLSRNSYHEILLVLESQTTHKIMRTLVENDHQISVVHWDHWSWWQKEKAVPLDTYKNIYEILSCDLIKGHLVPSRNYALSNFSQSKLYRVLYPFYAPADNTIKKNRDENYFHIVFAGQNYAKPEYLEFLNALNEINWHSNNKTIILHNYGYVHLETNPNIVNHGFKDPNELIQVIGSYDFAFLPYPRNEDMRLVSEQSLPSKFALYLHANLPIIYLGPMSAPIAEYVHQIGIALPEIKQDTAQKIFSSMIRFERNLEKFHFLQTEIFSKSNFRKNLYMVLGISDIFEENKEISIMKSTHILDFEIFYYRRLSKIYSYIFDLPRIFTKIKVLIFKKILNCFRMFCLSLIRMMKFVILKLGVFFASMKASFYLVRELLRGFDKK